MVRHADAAERPDPLHVGDVKRNMYYEGTKRADGTLKAHLETRKRAREFGARKGENKEEGNKRERKERGAAAAA